MLCEVLPCKIHVETICEVLMNHPPDTLGQILVVQFYFHCSKVVLLTTYDQ